MYGKLFSQMYDGTLGTKGPWQALVTFQQMIIMADKDGIVDMTAEALSRRTTIPLEVIELGIVSLLQPDEHSRSPDEDGKRIVPLDPARPWGWKIVNYEKYRRLRSEDERREYHRQYWHKRKLNTSTSTQQTQPIAVSSKQYAVSSKQEKTGAPKVPSDVSPKVWDDFLKVRRQLRAAVTETALRGIRREADKAGITLEAALTMCCERSWRGFKAEWIEGKPVSKQQALEARNRAAGAEFIKTLRSKPSA